MDIFEETNFTERIINEKKKTLSAIKSAKEEELKRVSDSYDDNIKQVEENILLLNTALNNKKSIICEKSSFNIEDIALILCELLSKIENEEYIYRKIEVINNVTYVLEKLNRENNKYVILKYTKAHIDNKKIKFYDNNLNEMIDFDDFSYLYDFINYVIKYKVKNNKDDLSLEELNYLLEEYIKIKEEIKKAKVKKLNN